ncbi:membrane-bound inhibitor of C-type lysozyme [Litoreibacter halocynthiae]|uniref:Membrane-bound inhibitor of C-type lysozyme n=1 Tax=Litoreibacter halocynthiae TaxID=1242689 RepID=A0A4R7LQE1_9RHOB|nr:MliC family protein [Litoreibacter halocynthiae]TDT77136.1 membrane-bound inhibitor of C-type lysozyme [Litoreibacter halocynthiae]
MMKLVRLLAIGLTAITAPAGADTTLSLAFELDDTDSVTSVIYDCGDGDAFTVQYVNAGANALALMEVGDEDRVFVNVVAASGARYVSGALVWWSKGDMATLENELSDGSTRTCQTQ